MHRSFTPPVTPGNAAWRKWQTSRRQSPPPRRSRQRGQTLVIFALSLTVLMGFAGLAIDVLRAYDLYAREERAAEAGALAGVIYMPNFYCTLATSIDNNSAITRALTEVQKNGFGAGVTPPSSCTGTNTSAAVTVCQVTSSGTALQVTVTQNIDVFLLSAIGIQSFNVSATTAADYLNPFVLGAGPSTGDSNVWGDGGSPNPKLYLASINGPAEFKEMGDPYVDCEDGTSLTPPVLPPTVAQANPNLLTATTPLTRTLSAAIPPYTTDAGFVTNDPQHAAPLCGPSQPDKQPLGFTGEATKLDTTIHPGAYNFAIRPTVPNATVWIYNPSFTATDAGLPLSSCNGAQNLDAFFQDQSCLNYYKSYGPLTLDAAGHFDDPRFHFAMTYSLYWAQSSFTRLADVPILPPAGTDRTFPPMDEIKADLAAHGCSVGQAYNLTEVSTYTAAGKAIVPGGCVAAPTSYNWYQIGTLPAVGTLPSAGQTYRLAVEATTFTPFNDPNPTCAQFQCGWGRHSYAVAVCAQGAIPSLGTCPSGGLISAWNNMDIYLNFPSSIKNNISVPLAYIPSAYAGRTVNLFFFDPGKSHGFGDNAYFLIVPPDPCIVVKYPTPTLIAGVTNNWVRTDKYPGTILNAPPPGACTLSTTSIYAAKANGATQPSDDIYNGLWVGPVPISLPSTYAGGQFYLDEFSVNGKNFNEFAVSITLAGGSPVHLIF